MLPQSCSVASCSLVHCSCSWPSTSLPKPSCWGGRVALGEPGRLQNPGKAGRGVYGWPQRVASEDIGGMPQYDPGEWDVGLQPPGLWAAPPETMGSWAPSAPCSCFISPSTFSRQAATSSRSLSWLKTDTKASLWAAPAHAGSQRSDVPNLRGFISVKTPWNCCQALSMASTGVPQRTVTMPPPRA